MIKIDCISDLHGHYPKLEGGDLLIVAGDLVKNDDPFQYGHFAAWMDRQRYKKKILIAGNHDNYFDRKGFESIKDVYESINVDYLCDSDTEFTYYDPRFPQEDEGFLPSGKRTLKIWGSPWTKSFPGMNPKCKAFTLDTEEQLAEKWALIPDDTDILITHSPPNGIMDQCPDYPSGKYKNCGSLSLLRKARSLPNLKLFVFGHIHEGYGILTPEDMEKTIDENPGRPPTCKTIPYLVNASHVDENYKPVNPPIRIQL